MRARRIHQAGSRKSCEALLYGGSCTPSNNDARGPIQRKAPDRADCRAYGRTHRTLRSSADLGAEKREVPDEQNESAMKTSRTALATDEIARLIFSGVFTPGQKLTEQELARTLNVSRIPIREALRELARDGLVRVAPRRGAHVARMNRADVAELYDVRATLEGLAAYLCAKHIGPVELVRLDGALGQMRQTVLDGDVDRYSQLTYRFRDIVAENAGNRLLREQIRGLSRRAMKFRFIANRIPGRINDALASNERLVEAIKVHDSRAAEMVAWLGVQNCKSALLNRYFGETVRADERTALERNLPVPERATMEPATSEAGPAPHVRAAGDIATPGEASVGQIRLGAE
jgi:DNA-binding GntR family transcriptional regulator